MPLKPDDRLDRAMELFVENDLLALPVVDGTPEGRIVGIVKRADVSSAYLRQRPRRGCSRESTSRNLARRDEFQNADDLAKRSSPDERLHRTSERRLNRHTRIMLGSVSGSRGGHQGDSGQERDRELEAIVRVKLELG